MGHVLGMLFSIGEEIRSLIAKQTEDGVNISALDIKVAEVKALADSNKQLIAVSSTCTPSYRIGIQGPNIVVTDVATELVQLPDYLEPSGDPATPVAWMTHDGTRWVLQPGDYIMTMTATVIKSSGASKKRSTIQQDVQNSFASLRVLAIECDSGADIVSGTITHILNIDAPSYVRFRVVGDNNANSQMATEALYITIRQYPE
jgi:hypothetical protein